MVQGDKRISTKLLTILQDGGHYSTIELTKLCGCAQASGIIRDLRKRYGYFVQSQWHINARGYRYKKFWIDPKNPFGNPDKARLDSQDNINFNFE